MQIVTIKDNDFKKAMAERVLRDLPKRFGIESSLVEHVESLDGKEFFAAKAPMKITRKRGNSMKNRDLRRCT